MELTPSVVIIPVASTSNDIVIVVEDFVIFAEYALK
jgi:hypothetical protein